MVRILFGCSAPEHRAKTRAYNIHPCKLYGIFLRDAIRAPSRRIGKLARTSNFNGKQQY